MESFGPPDGWNDRSDESQTVLKMKAARGLLLTKPVMKVLREYSRIVAVYASFAAFLAAEAAVIFMVYRHLGII